jgi:hypothetical protein
MTTYRVSLSFARLPDSELDAFVENIITSLTGNASFPTPAVSLADLTTALTAFTDAMAAATQGGRQANAAKNAAREALLALMRQEANYVQGIASTDLAMLLSSGFNNVSTNRTQSVLPAPLIQQIDNQMSTQLLVRLEPVDNARAYEVQFKNGTGGWLSAGTFTKARHIAVTDLTPGSTYTLQARAIGGSTGYSDWSDPVSHMAM